MCERGHSDWHQTKDHNGDTFCDYILGCVGVDGAGFKTILCCDIPIGDPMPVGMLKIGS